MSSHVLIDLYFPLLRNVSSSKWERDLTRVSLGLSFHGRVVYILFIFRI